MSLYDDASLVMIPSAIEDGKLYNVKPKPIPISGELITNGTFDTDSDWTKGTGWTISGGNAIYTGSVYASLNQSNALISGKFYKLQYEVISSSLDGDFKISGVTEAAQTPLSQSVGTHTVYFKADGSAPTNLALRVVFNTTGTLKIDNVSVIEVDVLPADFTFNRGSNLAATRVNKSGLIEKGRENLLTYSNDFSNGAWAKSNLSVASSNGAWEVTDNTTSGSHYLYWGGTTPSSSVLTLSVEAKAGSVNYLVMRLGGFTYAFFNLSNGTLGTIHSSFIDAKIEETSDGFYRCSATILTPSSGNASVFYPSDNSSSVSYTGTGAVAITIKDAQLEQGLVATDYIESGATTGKAGILEDLPRLDYSGGASCPSLLLEPTRTNIVPISEGLPEATGGVTLTRNYGTSPEGVQNSLKVQKIAVSANDRIFPISNYNAVLISGNKYTISCFVKNIDVTGVTTIGCRVSGGTLFRQPYQWSGASLTTSTYNQGGTRTNVILEDYGNGWWHIGFTFEADGTSGNFEIDIDRINGNDTTSIETWGWQFEQGNYSTSYIPTYETSVTRNKEQFNVNNVSGEIGQTQGTFFLDADLYKKTNTEFYIAISDGTLSNSLYLHQSSQSLLVNKRIAGVTEYLIITSANWSSGRNKCAITYTSTEIKIFVNGVLKDTESINGLPSGLSKFTLGSRQDNLGELASDANYKQAVLFPTILTDQECIELTTI